MIKAKTLQTFTTQVEAGQHLILADEPLRLGGKDLGMEPGQLLGAALASCTNITLRMYIDRKEWTVESIETKITYTNQAQTNLTRQITVKGNLDAEQMERLKTIANKCPIHKILEKTLEIHTQWDGVG